MRMRVCILVVRLVFAPDFLILTRNARDFATGVYTDIHDGSKRQAFRSQNQKRQAKKGPVAQVVRAHA